MIDFKLEFNRIVIMIQHIRARTLKVSQNPGVNLTHRQVGLKIANFSPNQNKT